MRKDLKLGLAAGGLLFGAILVYIVFFSGPKKTGPIARNTEGNRLTDVTPVRPTPTPGPTVVDNSTSGGGRPTTIPTTPAGSGTETADTSRTNWNYLLEHGDVNRTSTPPVGGGRGGRDSMVVIDGGPTSRPGGGLVTSADHKYVIKKGDTLWSIAKAAYGNANYVSHIVRANPGLNANTLKMGATIIVPPASDVIPASVGGLATVGPTTRPLDNRTEYRVKNGDNLYTISRALYGKNDRWSKIYDWNKELIGPNMGALKPNMVLRLQEPPTAIGTVAGAGN